MAWSAPRTWSVGEVVTASIMNTHVRDNLSYLKGGAGTVTIDADYAITRSAAGSTVGAYVDNTGGSSSGTLSRFTLGMTPAETNAGLFQFDHNANELTMFNRASGGNLVLQTNNGNTIVNTNGFALNVASPTGKLHGYNTISGFLAWEYNGLDGTVRTVIPDGTGDVLYGLSGIYISRCSDGTVTGGAMGAITPGGGLQQIGRNAASTDVFTLTVAANGSVTAARTTNATNSTLKVTIWIIWV